MYTSILRFLLEKEYGVQTNIYTCMMGDNNEMEMKNEKRVSSVV